MDLLQATLSIYRFAVLQSADRLRKNWAVIFAPLGYGIILSISSALLAPFGIIGGLLLILASDACMSSGLHLIENIVNNGRANLQDGLRGFGVHLWEIVQISFILWVPLTLASRALGPTPNGPLLLLFIQILLYIFLNAVPELMYQSRAQGIELLPASFHFIMENWLEWLAPNLAVLAVGYFLVEGLSTLVEPLPFPVATFIVLSVSGGALMYWMIFRGILFAELNGTTRRSRVYRYKTDRWA
jgi:hypothetical protein